MRSRLRPGAVVALLTALLTLAACRLGTRNVPSTTPFDEISYNEDPVPPSAKVFLVAGGDDVANFAAEVLEQRRLWTAAGLGPDEIVCYYAKPTPRAYGKDLDQYERVMDSLRDCRRADPSRLRQDLLTVADQDPPFIYLYISTHGLDSLTRIAREMHEDGNAGWYPSLTIRERQILDQHVLAMQAGPGPALEDVGGLLEALRAGSDPRDLMLTPTYLAETLAAFPPTTLSIVVLQGCFSGGFIGHDPAPGDAPRDPPVMDLRTVPRIIALVATAQNRPSFGCSAGEERTYFGGAVTRVLGGIVEEGMTPADVPWEQVFTQTLRAVTTMEMIREERPSLPGFYSNVPAPSENGLEGEPDPAATPE